MELFRPDRPVESEPEDKFQRYHFAKRIAGIIADNTFHSSLVIGIYGKWGEGKSSVMKFIEKEVEAKAVVVNFNPWLFSDQQQLLRSFFEAIASAVGKNLQTKKERAAKVFTDYADSVGSLTTPWIVPGIFTVGKKIAEKLRKDSNEELKRRVDNLIIESDVNFVIFVDDIDRLDAEEIQSVFKLVKLLGDFPRTTYVLSFDDDMVAAAIGPKYSAGTKEDGYHFLEKIIQVPLYLPKASSKALRDYTLELAVNALNASTTVINKKSVDRFIKTFDDYFLPVLNNPRLGVRLANSIGFSVPLLVGEVNFGDLLIIESLKTFYPQTYHFIRDKKEYFLTVFSTEESVYGSLVGPSKEEAKQRVNEHLASIPETRRGKMLLLLTDLFPQLQSVYQNYVFHDQNKSDWHRNQRICSPQHFDRYFSFVVQTGDISDVFFADVLKGLSTLDFEEFRVRFAAQMQLVPIEDLLFKFRNWEQHLSPLEAKLLASTLASLGNSYAACRETTVFSALSMAAYFIARLLISMPDDQVVNAAMATMNITQPMDLLFEITYHLTELGEEIAPGKKLKEGTIRTIRKIAVAKFKEQIKTTPLLSVVNESNFSLAVLWWRKYDNAKELKEMIAENMEKDLSFSFQFVKAFTPTILRLSHRPSGNTEIKSNFTAQTYSDLAEIADPRKLLVAMEREFGEIFPIKKLPPEQTALSEEEIRGVFKRFYLQVKHQDLQLPEPWTKGEVLADLEKNDDLVARIYREILHAMIVSVREKLSAVIPEFLNARITAKTNNLHINWNDKSVPVTETSLAGQDVFMMGFDFLLDTYKKGKTKAFNIFKGVEIQLDKSKYSIRLDKGQPWAENVYRHILTEEEVDELAERFVHEIKEEITAKRKSLKIT